MASPMAPPVVLWVGLIVISAIGVLACGARTEPLGLGAGGSSSDVPAGNRPTGGQVGFGGATGVGGTVSVGGSTNVGGATSPEGQTPRVVAGNTHSCALRDGQVMCWGSNSFGQLGDLTLNDRSHPVLAQVVYSGATEVAVGGYHTCVEVEGAVYCFGYNGFG